MNQNRGTSLIVTAGAIKLQCSLMTTYMWWEHTFHEDQNTYGLLGVLFSYDNSLHLPSIYSALGAICWQFSV